eukprot:scaffold8152_cov195-Amphora_coffeaeformis.AAC.7
MNTTIAPSIDPDLCGFVLGVLYGTVVGRPVCGLGIFRYVGNRQVGRLGRGSTRDWNPSQGVLTVRPVWYHTNYISGIEVNTHGRLQRKELGFTNSM